MCVVQSVFAFNTRAQPANDLCRMILLDNQSICDIFCNSKLLRNIPKTPKTMQVIGNCGLIITNRQGHLKHYGDVWFDERAITNILCLKNTEKKYHGAKIFSRLSVSVQCKRIFCCTHTFVTRFFVCTIVYVGKLNRFLF